MEVGVYVKAFKHFLIKIKRCTYNNSFSTHTIVIYKILSDPALKPTSIHRCSIVLQTQLTNNASGSCLSLHSLCRFVMVFQDRYLTQEDKLTNIGTMNHTQIHILHLRVLITNWSIYMYYYIGRSNELYHCQDVTYATIRHHFQCSLHVYYCISIHSNISVTFADFLEDYKNCVVIHNTNSTSTHKLYYTL